MLSSSLPPFLPSSLSSFVIRPLFVDQDSFVSSVMFVVVQGRTNVVRGTTWEARHGSTIRGREIVGNRRKRRITRRKKNTISRGRRLSIGSILWREDTRWEQHPRRNNSSRLILVYRHGVSKQKAASPWFSSPFYLLVTPPVNDREAGRRKGRSG